LRSDQIHIDLRQLRYFLAVYDELHFGRAARRLQMAQPPLSQAIRRLEDELGVALLHRSSRAVTATDAGLVFAAEARKVLAALDVAVSEARRAEAKDAGLQIGCVPHIPLERLHRLVSAIMERAPFARPRVQHLPAAEQLARLEQGGLDLSIVDDVVEAQRNLHVLPLFRGGAIGAVVPVGHDLAGAPALSPDDVASEQLVMFPRRANPGLHDSLLVIFRSRGYRFRRVIHATGPSRRDMMLGVAQGDGVALLPASTQDVVDSSAVVVFRPLTKPVFMPDTVLAWRAGPPARLVESLATIREIAGKLYSEDAPGMPGRAPGSATAPSRGSRQPRS
jgi:DNA-binding transcriptional LysR family regulator